MQKTPCEYEHAMLGACRAVAPRKRCRKLFFFLLPARDSFFFFFFFFLLSFLTCHHPFLLTGTQWLSMLSSFLGMYRCRINLKMPCMRSPGHMLAQPRQAPREPGKILHLGLLPSHPAWQSRGGATPLEPLCGPVSSRLRGMGDTHSSHLRNPPAPLATGATHNQQAFTNPCRTPDSMRNGAVFPSLPVIQSRAVGDPLCAFQR